MGCLTQEFNLQHLAGKGLGSGGVIYPRVHHHSNVHISEGSPLGHNYLTPTHLFRRCADNEDTPPKPVNGRPGGSRSPNGTGSDEIMTTGMPEPGQGIVFSENGDNRFSLSITCAEGSRQPAGPLFYREAVFLKVLAQPGDRFCFLKARFRVGVNP